MPNSAVRIIVILGLLVADGLAASSDDVPPWEIVGPGAPSPSSPSTIAVVPGYPDTAYVGTSYDGVYRSRDGGASWVQVGPAFNCLLLTADPANAARLFLISREGPYVSLDAGDTWALAETGSAGVTDSAAVFTADALGQVYAASTSGLIWLFDGQRDWTRINSDPLPSIRSLAAAPSDPNVLYAGTKDGVWRSDDAGHNWRVVAPDLIQTGSWEARSRWTAIDPDNAEVAFSCADYDGQRAVFRTEDGGVSWTAVFVGGPLDLQFDARWGLYLAAGSALRSSDHGTSWDTLRTGNAHSALGLGAPLSTAGESPRLYSILLRRDELRISDDGGQSWPVQPSADVVIHDLTVSPIAPHPTYILGSTAMYRTEAEPDSMTWDSWQALDLPGAAVDAAPGRLWPDPHRPNSVYIAYSVGAASMTLHRLRWTPDGETAWEALFSASAIDAFIADPSDPNVATLAASDLVFTTRDRGQTWTRSQTRLPAAANDLLADATEPGHLYAATAQGVYASRDTAATWTAVSPSVSVGTLAQSPWTSWHYAAYAGRGPRVILVSPDQGGSWHTSGPLPEVRASFEGPFPPTMQRIFFDATDSSVVYALTHHEGIFASRDGGQTWRRVSPGIVRETALRGNDDLQLVRASANHPGPEHSLLVAGQRGLYVRTAIDLQDDGSAPPDTTGEPTEPTQLAALRWRFLGPSVIVADQLSLGTSVSLLEQDPQDAGAIFAATGSGHMYRLQRGQPLVAAEQGLPGTTILDLVADPVSERLFAATLLQGVYALDLATVDPTWVPWNGARIFTSVWGLSVTATGRLYAALNGLLLSTETHDPAWNGVEIAGRFRAMVTHPQRPDWALAVDPLDGLLESTDAGASWRLVSGIRAERVVISSDTGTLYALTVDARILRSPVDEYTWTELELPSPGRATSITVTRATDRERLLVGMQGGIHASHDGGNTWDVIGAGLPDADVTDVLQHPQFDDLFYAATGHGLFTTDPLADAMASDSRRLRTYGVPQIPEDARWRREHAAVVTNIGISVVDTGLVLFNTESEQLQRARTGTWRPAGDNAVRVPAFGPVRATDLGWIHDHAGFDRWFDSPDDFRRLGLAAGADAINPRNPRVQYHGLRGWVMKSKDGGQRWDILKIDESGNFSAVAIDPYRPLTVYAGSNDPRFPGIFRSRDGGSTFETIATGEVTGIEVSWLRPDELYAVLSGEIVRSRDAGNSWRALGSPDQQDVQILRLAFASPDVVYAVTSAGVYISVDAASTWHHLNTGFPRREVYDLAIHPVHPLTAYAATANGIYSLNAPLIAPEQTPTDSTEHEEPDVPLPGDDAPIPLITRLQTPYPNPSTGAMTVSFDLSEPELVTIVLYDVLGQPVRTLARERFPAGTHSFQLSQEQLGRSFARTGLWLLRFRAGDTIETGKILFVR